MNINDCSNSSDFESLIEKSRNKLHCKLCPGVYKREGNMRNHMESKQGKLTLIKGRNWAFIGVGLWFNICLSLLM